MGDRLSMLERLVADGEADSFGYYALAMEYKSKGRVEDAVSVFTSLRETDAAYLPMYLMAGQMLATAGRVEEARDWLTDGVTRAEAAGDVHAMDAAKKLLAVL